MKLSFFLILCTLAGLSWAECSVNSEKLGAMYQITEVNKKFYLNKKKNTSNRRLNLWRNGKEVAHEYPDSQITEIWNLVVDGRVRPVRYFDKDKRGIEYQPGDVNNGRGERNWSAKYQLISERNLASMTLISAEGSGCDKQEVYELKNAKSDIRIVWLPELQLAKQYRQKAGKASIQWELLKIEYDAKLVSEAFTKRADYQTTDYADIGDNESDPFLMNLINLGFVSHGASGFYDDQGNAISGSHIHR